jgi:hypothetical protein
MVALLVACPAAVRAQFSTFIPPKAPSPDSAVNAARQKAKADSATAARIANMKRWVDSAAGIPPRSMRGADTILSPQDTAQVQVATAHGRPPSPIVEPPAEAPKAPPPSERRVEGRAPATASDLPLVILTGVLSLMTGLILLCSAPRKRRRHA